MKRGILFLITAYIILASPTFLIDAEAKKVPKYIKNLVFVDTRFSEPITANIPCEDTPGLADEIRKTEEKAEQEYLRAIKSGGLAIPKVIIWQTCLDKTGYLLGQEMLNFLETNDYVKVDKITVNLKSSKGSKSYKFLYYKNKLTPYILKRAERGSTTDALLDSFRDMPVNSSKIFLASRKLKSIDYTNKYDGILPYIGAKTQFYALTFSYVLEEKLQGLPKVNNVYHGKAKAYFDPDDGQWKLWRKIELDDSGRNEYMDLIKQQYKVISLTDLENARLQSWVVDYTGTLSSKEIDLLRQKLNNYEKESSNQIVVLLINWLDGHSINEYSMRLGNKWGIGQKGKDNGVLIILALRARQWRIAVGYGLEEALPDKLLGSIGKKHMTYYLKKGNYYEAIASTIDNIIKSIRPQQKALEEKWKEKKLPR